MDIQQVIKHLEFTVNATEQLYTSRGEVPPGLSPFFYHTLTYEGDLELAKKTRAAREFLETIKSEIK